MHRIDYDPDTRNKHEELQIQLGRVLGDLQVTLVNGEKPNEVLIVSVISAVERWRPELEHCNGLEIKYIPGLMPDFYPLHADLLKWLTNLSIDLKLRSVSDAPKGSLTASRIEEGFRMINRLSCRERLVWR